MPSIEEEIIHIRRQLDKIVDGTKEMVGVLELIETLSTFSMSIEIITKTRIGLTVNALRKKTTDEKVAKKSKSLIRTWKKLIDDKAGPAPSRSSKSGSDANGSRSGSEAPSTQSDTPSGSKPAPKTIVIATTGQKAAKNGKDEEIRRKAREMLSAALRIEEMPDGTHDPDELATRIEAHLYEFHQETGLKYRAALRSRTANLRDKKNPALRENVLTGVVTAKQFARMTSEEMASDEMKKVREKFTQESIQEHQMAVQEGTPSDMFKCGKCRQKNCTYTQVQTRSADEPMTTFVWCRTCGNRWKFC